MHHHGPNITSTVTATAATTAASATASATTASGDDEKVEKQGKFPGGAAVGKHTNIWPPLPKESFPKDLANKEPKNEEKKEVKMEEKKEEKKDEKDHVREVIAAAGKKNVMDSKGESKSVPGISSGGSGVQVGVTSTQVGVTSTQVGVNSTQVGVGARSSSFVTNAIAAVNDHKSFADKDGNNDRDRGGGGEERQQFTREKENPPLPLPISPSKKTLATDDNIPTADEPISSHASVPTTAGT